MSNKPEVQHLEAVGNTVRLSKAQPVFGALLVGGNLASHYWLNLLSLARDQRVRYYVTEDDYAIIMARMHVQPRVVDKWASSIGARLGLAFFSGVLPWIHRGLVSGSVTPTQPDVRPRREGAAWVRRDPGSLGPAFQCDSASE